MKPDETLNSIARDVNEINRKNGWNVLTPDDWIDKYKVPAVLALIHSEVSEALEGFRVNNRGNFDEEIADIMIRCLDLCGGLGINIDAEITRKLGKNAARGFRHGGKKL